MRHTTTEAPVTNIVLHTVRSNWCGNGRPPLTRKYARVIGIEAPISSDVTPTSREYPVRGRVRTRQIKLPAIMAERLREYLTNWSRNNAASSYGSDEMLDLPFWLRHGEHLDYGTARDTAEDIIEAGHMRHTTRERLGLGQIGIFGYVTPPGYLNNVEGAVLGLGDQGYRSHCLFGQDGIVGVATLNRVNTNLQELAHRQQLADGVPNLRLFADPGRP
ncbi:MAG TPA: hypothetical protein VLI54_00410 [Bacillota bacterium]|nr:hypothetical protein [Bacillota bacterium]